MSICDRIYDEACRISIKYGMRRGPTHLILGVRELEEVRREVSHDSRLSWSGNMPPSFFQSGWDASGMRCGRRRLIQSATFGRGGSTYVCEV